MSKAKKKMWSQSLGPYGAKVRVAELTPGGRLYLLWVDGSLRQRKRSLGHRDRLRGKREAMELSSRLLNFKDSHEGGQLTVGRLIHLYLKEGLHGTSKQYRAEVERKLQRWSAFLTPERAVETLSPADVARFIENRKLGELGSARTRSKPLSNTTLWHDLVALQTALNFAVLHREGDRRVLTANPLQGVKVPKTVNPAQPVADLHFYTVLRRVSDDVAPLLGLALDLALTTGHRINAILNLRWTDIDFTSTEAAPFGTILWREEHDKIGNEHLVPMHPLAAASLRTATARIDSSFVFPSPSDSTRPLDRRLASRWFKRAERLANVPREQGRGWHSLRRAWASDRKHLPDVDVAAAGGWKDVSTMKGSYQHADKRGVLSAVIGSPMLDSLRLIPAVIPPAA